MSSLLPLLPRRAAPLALLLGPIALLPGQTERSAEARKLVTVRRGNLPLILSAPHGGRLPIPGDPAREGLGVAKFNPVRDANTAELAERVAAAVERRLRARPYLVVARFDRKYLDANRPAPAAYESEEARPVYDAYHQALTDACRAVQKKWRRGLLLDIHGQGKRPGTIIRGTADGKTVTLLLRRFGPAALSGPRSVLGRLERRGYDVFPPAGSRAREDPRYRGGYTVRAYGSHTAFGIDALQVELGATFRTKKVLDRTARDLAEALAVFAGAYLPERAR
jgi:N-formylglutamate amidohydrolase